MRVERLIELLQRFDPESEVRLSVALPDRVVAAHASIWVADYGGGPQLNAVLDLRQLPVYVGLGVEQAVTKAPSSAFDPSRRDAQPEHSDVDLGEYESPEMLAKVRDFFNYHRRPGEPLTYPDFDYANWIAPRTTSGQYNEHVAEILKERLLKE
jgi:hypothetical protein